MKFTIEREELARAVAAASRAVSSKSTLAFLEGVYLAAEEKGLRLTGYNLETGITVNAEAGVRETGACVMPARMISDIVRKLPEGTVSVEVNGDYQVRVKGGSASFRFLALSAEEYPTLPTVEQEHEVRLPQSVLRSMIGGTLFAASSVSPNPILTGCLMETAGDRVTMVGCDGYRLAMRSCRVEDAAFPKLRFVVPTAGLKELEKVLEADGSREVRFSPGRQHVSFETEELRLICRLLEGSYITWEKFLRADDAMRLSAKTAELSAAVERVALIISEKYKAALRCHFGLHQVELRASTTVADAAEICPLEGDGRETDVAFSSRYLLEALKAVPTEEVKVLVSGGLRPVLLVPPEEDGSYVYLINPVRMNPQQ